MGPLKDITVLDLTTGFAGEYTAMMMSDLGAEVIRLENPAEKAYEAGPSVNGHFVSDLTLNRGKKRVFMDLKQPEMKKLFFSMIKTADAVIADCLLKDLEEAGCGFEVLKEINSRIILTLLTPFGQTGPLSGRAADETTLQAMSGVMSMVGDFGGEPVRIGTETAESAGACYAFIGTMAAIYSTMSTGEGSIVDIAELDAMLTTGEAPVIRYDMAGMIPVLNGNRHVSTVPLGDFACRDGGQLAISVTTDDQYARFADVLEAPELLDGDLRFGAERVRQRERTEDMVNKAFAKYDSKEVMSRLESANIPFGVINDAAAIAADEQILAHNMIATVKCSDGTTVKAVASPMKISGMEDKTEFSVSGIGSDSIAVASNYIPREEAEALYAGILSSGKETEVCKMSGAMQKRCHMKYRK